jgi:hypothetical protein
MATATLDKSMADYSTVPTSTTMTSTTTVQTTTAPPIVIKSIELPALPVRGVSKPYIERKVAEIEPAEAKVFAELLTAAAERLRTYGWVRGVMGGSKGPNCAVGAIEQTATLEVPQSRSLQMERLYSAVVHFNGMRAMFYFPDSFSDQPEAARNSIIYWNDGMARRRNDVIFAFEKTAAELKALSEVPAA